MVTHGTYSFNLVLFNLGILIGSQRIQSIKQNMTVFCKSVYRFKYSQLSTKWEALFRTFYEGIASGKIECLYATEEVETFTVEWLKNAIQTCQKTVSDVLDLNLDPDVSLYVTVAAPGLFYRCMFPYDPSAYPLDPSIHAEHSAVTTICSLIRSRNSYGGREIYLSSECDTVAYSLLPTVLYHVHQIQPISKLYWMTSSNQVMIVSGGHFLSIDVTPEHLIVHDTCPPRFDIDDGFLSVFEDRASTSNELNQDFAIWGGPLNNYQGLPCRDHFLIGSADRN